MLNALSLLPVIVVLALALSVVVFQAITGVPPMSASAVEAADVAMLLRQADLPEHVVVYDLGCGWGALVMALSRAFPEAQIRGVEMSPLPYWVARFRTRNMPNVVLRRGDFYKHPLQDADAVTCYLLIKSMPPLADFLDRTLRPGTPVVSLAFWFRGRQVSAVRQGAGLLGQAALYYWPAHKADVR